MGVTVIYNGTRYDNPPSEWQPITIIYESALLGSRDSHENFNDVEINWRRLDAVIEKISDAERVVFDIELWDAYRVSDIVRWKNICKLKEIARYVKYKLSDVDFGFYGRPPELSYPSAILNDPAWQSVNSDYAYLAEFVDTIYPSLYVRYNDYAKQYLALDNTISECAQYNKPIVPFISARYFGFYDQGDGVIDGIVDDAAFDAVLDYLRDRGIDGVMWDKYVHTQTPALITARFV